jgi:hypothetical protein
MPVLAAYLLHWGVWAVEAEAEQVVMSVLTKALNWFGDHSLANFARIEEATWSARYLAEEALTFGLVPIVLGLLLGWWVLRRNRKASQSAI